MPTRLTALLLGLIGLHATAIATTATPAVDPSCQLRHPIVLSHVWSITPICRDATLTGAQSCEATQDYARLCAVKSTGADGQPQCLKWQTPAEDMDLPPRNTNAFEPGLHRDLSAYHRHFSRAIVNRLRDTCGNAVYIADKPPFASYAVRARVLRETVLQALRETGADKVNVIGMSQGVQDARFMTVALPLDMAQPQGAKMAARVASVVSLVGEDSGAETAGLGLQATLLLNGGVWSKVQPSLLKTAQPALNDATWRRPGQGLDQIGQLVEACQSPQECDVSITETQYRWLLRSLVDLSPAFMRPSLVTTLGEPLVGWRKLLNYTWQPDASWQVQVPASAESNNGVRYMAYANWMRKPSDTLDQTDIFYLVSLFKAQNDGYVSVASQQFRNTAPNFENVHLMKGQAGSVGYHHMFTSGRNDRMYSPTEAALQEAAPYNGSSADVFQQILRDMKARGL
jgi:pimeloyl-ACP methyl ester carboxylesterase